tara:strand:- start:2085 stop:3179 length:1095 start_codon:yes stop_codon:yes gene_type:complete
MEGPKPSRSEDYSHIVSFLNEQLRPDQEWSIANEYPTAITPHNHLNMHIVKDEQKIVSHALARDLIIKSPMSLFKVATIGSVVTDSKYRNQGLSKKTILNCLEAGAERGCDFALLWTDLHDFYSKMGFQLAGSEISYNLDRPVRQSGEPLNYIEGNRVSAQAIAQLYNKHTVVSLRNASDIQKYLSIPAMRVYTAWDASNRLRAYAVEGKGIDLHGYIHEWGGDLPDLFSLISFMQKKNNMSYTFIAPLHSQNLHRQLQGLGFKSNHGYLGMFKILNARSLFLKITNYARSVGLVDFVLEAHEGDQFVIGRKGKTYQTDSLQEITSLIFGPSTPNQLKDFDPETRQIIEKILPLPMWVWGWDSV